MKIIEALKNLKTIEKRIVSNAVKITEYASYVSVDTPIFETEQKQSQEVQSLIQSNLDLITEYNHLKLAIDKTNLATKVKVGSFAEKSISEIIVLRRTMAKMAIGTYSALNMSGSQKRIQEVFKSIDPENPPRVVTLWDETKKNEELRKWAEFLEQVDGTLEVVNATTDLLE